ncbi:ultraviolet-B receptor UVR8 isoform X2 [Ricinus communis]|uniref:Cell cycle regulatory protein, putative n=1 Tax=Ricinus communis TaxID=3988 RepID=B9SEZ8_RICCO|nr:ultraviolet-B receptor UVR8 isoform X2 [Ricinus communis]EEF37775.1 cell cycle regulatory protein, putative [Ricinus communis]|eukprot:XP_002524567.1 ultraviolet-B receptor UVR8 isoform X2 [Ricinus communis]
MLRIRALLRKEQNLLNATRRCISSFNHRDTIVMSFGDGSHGALGLPNSLTGLGTDAYEPTIVSGLPSDIVGVTAGHYHSLAVTSTGQLWAWGRNNEAQLGRCIPAPRDTWNEPKRVEGLNKVHILSAYASGVVSAAIANDGSLWVWGKSKRGQLGLGKGITEAFVPSKIEALAGTKIAKVSFGWGHALALSEEGKLFGWGYSADGRLGKIMGALEVSALDSNANQQVPKLMLEASERLVLEGMEKENDMPILWDPCLVEELHGTKVVDIACGLDHSLVLCCDGTLLSSGSNIYGQLGRANHEIGLFPVDLNIHPSSIAAGLGHSLAICRAASSDAEGDARNIVSWGWNQSSQLGRLGPEGIPLEIEGLAGEIPVSVSGGRVHSIALTSKGEVWVWGCGKNGRLGLGSSSDEAEPILLDSLEGYEVLQIVSGFDHNLVLASQ